MAEVDHRRVMSTAEFDAIPVDDGSLIYGYYEALIDWNDQIGPEVCGQSERFQELTAGQRMLIQLAAFDGQVKNGGITQFFWNRAESIFDVGDWIEFLSVAELQANYDRALEALVGKKDRWLELRAAWTNGRDGPTWESFQKSYELLDLGWFDTAYFDKRGYNERQEWVVHSKGLHHELLTRLVEFIRSRRSEFIIEPGKSVTKEQFTGNGQSAIVAREGEYDLEVVGNGHAVTVASGVVRRLDARGNGHQITVRPGAEVLAIHLSGEGITVRLPAGAQPTVKRSGIDCTVTIEPGVR
jgi:Domain of unknown function (DUF4375)